MNNQRGYFLILAVIFIMVIGVMGTLIAYLFSSHALLSVAEQNGFKAFYNAESGLEIGTRLLTMPTITGTPLRVTCGSLTGTSTITNASLGGGTFTVATVNSSPVYATTTLSTAQAATDTVINATSTSGFAPSGRILIDNEAINYAAISGNTFIGVTRGMSNTLASSHASGAGIGQYQCTLDSQAGIPNLTSPSYQRQLQQNIQLQDGWVVGNFTGSNFVLTRWNHSTEKAWNILSVAGGANVANLTAVSMLSNADGWATGDIVGSNFVFLHWTGASWTASTVAGACSGGNLAGISTVSSQQGFAVGVRYKPACGGGTLYRYSILRWNGSAWSLLTPSTSPSIPADASTNQNLNAVHVIDTSGNGLADVGFAVGNSGKILQYNGTNWIAVTSPTTQNLMGVFTVSASEAWAVGAAGVILHWNGSTWSSVTSPTTIALNAIAMIDTNGNGVADAGWGVGDTGRIVAYNGSTWTTTTAGTNNLLGVDIMNSSDVWAAGASGTIYHWDGAAWTSISSGTTNSLNGISLISPGQHPVSTWKQVFN